VHEAALTLLLRVEKVHQQLGVERAAAQPRGERAQCAPRGKSAYGHKALTRIFSRAWMTASSRLIDSTAPLLAV
jgi:hypothetical protein